MTCSDEKPKGDYYEKDEEKQVKISPLYPEKTDPAQEERLLSYLGSKKKTVTEIR